MLIINIICGIIVGLWLWSLLWSYNRRKFITFLVRLLLGVFILIPILTFVIRRFSKANMMRQSSPSMVMMMPPTPMKAPTAYPTGMPQTSMKAPTAYPTGMSPTTPIPSTGM